MKLVGADRPPLAAGRTSAVLVLGMSRSGTSSVAGALVGLGGTAPRHLMPASPHNARGYWESTVLMRLNDDILAAGGSNWSDWRRFDAGRIASAQINALRDRAKAALVDEFEDSVVPIIKDPRMCRLMGFWNTVFQDLAWSPRAVLPVRSPLEVAWSLHSRDGSSVARNCLVWLRHVLDAEAATRGMKRVFLDWSRLLEDCRASLGLVAERLNVRLARGDDPRFAEVENFLSSKLRRFSASPDEVRADPAVTDLVREVHAAMLDLVEDADCAPTLRRLDALRTRFEDSAAIFRPAMDESGRAAQAQERTVAGLEHSLQTSERARTAREAEAADLRRACEDLETRNRELEQRLFVQGCDFATQLAEAHGRAREQGEAIARANAFINRYALETSSDKRRRLTRAARPPRTVNRLELSVLKRSPFLDETFYLDRYPDVSGAGMDAALHYLLHGAREGRDPGPFFSTNAYLARYPDVAATGANALLHYETHGRREGREAIRDFKA